MTDLTAGHIGKNSFYVIQIIEHENKLKWSLFTKWGRIGQAGSHKIVHSSSKKDLIEEFHNMYYIFVVPSTHQFV